MTDTITKQLERLKNRCTAYELAMTHPDGRSFLIRYTNRRTRSGLYNCCYQAAVAIDKVAGTDFFTPAKRAADGGTIGEWTIAFTGRTQRDAIINGELVFIED